MGVARTGPESLESKRRDLVRVVGVRVIQEGEERPSRLPRTRAGCQPLPHEVVYHSRFHSVSFEQLSDVSRKGPHIWNTDLFIYEIDEPRQPFDRFVDQYGHAEGGQVREDVIAIDGEAAAQPGIRATIPSVGDEARRGVALRPQDFAQRGIGGVERSVPAGRELVRPSSREEARVGGKRPRSRRLCGREADAATGHHVDCRAGGAVVAVESQVVRRDGIQHDQEDVRGAWWRHRLRRFAPLLEPVAAPDRRCQDPHQAGDDREADPDHPAEAGAVTLQDGNQPRRDPQRHQHQGPVVDLRQRHQRGREQGRGAEQPRGQPAPAVAARRGSPSPGGCPAPGRRRDSSTGPATRSDGSSSKDDSDRTWSFARPSPQPRAVPRPGRTRPARSEHP